MSTGQILYLSTSTRSKLIESSLYFNTLYLEQVLEDWVAYAKRAQ